MKKIFLHDFAGHPFQFDLSLHLVKYGYSIVHSFAFQDIGPKANFAIKKQKLLIAPVKVFFRFNKKKIISRVFWEISYALYLVKLIRHHKPDYVIFSNTPILIIIITLFFTPIKYIWWVQDIFSIAALKLEVLPKFFRYFAFKILNFFENFISSRSLKIILISNSFLPFFIKFSDKVNVIENWSPICKAYSSRALVGKYLIYSGTIGEKHSPDMLIQIIYAALKKGLKFILVSEGQNADFIKSHFSSFSNFVGFNFLDSKKLHQLIAQSVGCVVILNKEASNISVPSKTYTYLRCEIPVLGIMDKNHDTANLITRNNFGVINNFDLFFSRIQDANWLSGFKKRVRAYNKKENNTPIKVHQFIKLLEGLN